VSDSIELRGIRAVGHHGVYEHERRDGQEFVVDVVLHLDLAPAARSDDVADTVHYGELAERIAEIIAGPAVALIETLATRIADAALQHGIVEAVDVVVHKPQAPIAVPFTDAAVRISRRADHRAVLALGTNLGDRDALLASAVQAIAVTPGISLTAESPVVESDAVTPTGVDPDRPGYLNQVLLVRTSLDPFQLLAVAQRVEREHGRVRGERWADRTLDVDIVGYDALELYSAELELPHPRAAERAFVLVPWSLVDPDAVLPGRGRVAALAGPLADEVVVRSA
jgi:dihydroneopterin aldolase / 2-amino-4-hydroxy-6-hydroxymethyldihydropteridine diphosphokinase